MPESHPIDLAATAEALGGSTVLCLGDIMLDRFIYGAVDRVSPEAPIPVFRIERERAMLGGAGNVVRNVVALGARALFLSVVGDDEAGHELMTLVGAEARIAPHLVVAPGRPSTIKTRYIAGGQQLLRADSEVTTTIPAATIDALFNAAAATIADCGAIVLSDYAKGVLTSRPLDTFLAAARAAGKPVVVDPKGGDFSAYMGASVLTPNRRELAAATHMAVDKDADIVAAARHVIDACALDAVLATRGRDGLTLVEADGGVAHFPAEAREVFDVSGAGDTVAATFAAALAAGAAYAAAARLANHAAGVVVAKLGTAVASSADLIASLRGGAEAKVMPLTAIADRVAQWRDRGQRIGFTNGCFDLLHPGHIGLLGQARGACDRLVVGLNGDASARRLKGAGRPVQNQAARAMVLASLSCVDVVVIFDEDTPITLIEALRPDILVKGADYTLDQVVGADIVRGYGGEVMLADLAPGHSTTRTIARLRG